MNNAETLNDLIKINNDRVAGYEKAALQTTDETLLSLFVTMADQSDQFSKELKTLVKAVGDDPATGTTFAGKIYRLWMDVKVTFTGKDQNSLVKSCIMGENAAIDSYILALEDKDLSPDIRRIIERQKAALDDAHNKIKSLVAKLPA